MSSDNTVADSLDSKGRNDIAAIPLTSPTARRVVAPVEGVEGRSVSERPAGAGLDHELEAPPWRRFESTLMATSKSIRRAYDLRFSRIGLNLSEACLLEYVVEHGPMTQTHVAKSIGMRRASAGTIITGLCVRGVLERFPDAADHRVWQLSATAEGYALASQIAAVDEALRIELRRDVSSRDRKLLAKTLLQMQTNLTAILADGGDPTG